MEITFLFNMGEGWYIQIIEIIDIECVLGHESCLHFFRKCPFKSAMLNLTRSWTAEL